MGSQKPSKMHDVICKWPLGSCFYRILFTLLLVLNNEEVSCFIPGLEELGEHMQHLLFGERTNKQPQRPHFSKSNRVTMIVVPRNQGSGTLRSQVGPDLQFLGQIRVKMHP